MNDRSVGFVMAGSRGLGLGSARALVEQGCAVAFCGRTAASIEAAETELKPLGRAAGFVGDVSEPQELSQAIAKARAAFGRINILVANSGGPAPGSFESVGDDQWQAGYQLVVGSVVRAIQDILPDMRESGWGRIVIIGSSSIRKPIPNLSISNMLRPALNGLVKDLAVTLAPERITVNMVAPGRIDTDRVRKLDAANAERRGCSPDQVREESLRAIPMGRYGEPSELGDLVAFLASEKASYITGQSILVDGGMTASMP